MYGRVERAWRQVVKDEHEFYLHIREGVLQDMLFLFMDKELVVQGKAHYLNMKDYALFDVDGRTFELRWVWHWWGHPISVVLMHKGSILYQYGTNRAAQDDVIESK